MLSQNELKNILFYKDGFLYWSDNKKLYGKTKCGDRAGFDHPFGYRKISINNKDEMEHRVIYTLLKGEIPKGLLVDHIDFDRTNNNIGNLRLVNTSESVVNRRLSSNNTSQIIGVSFHKNAKLWVARIVINKKRVHLGSSKDKGEAIKLYRDAFKKAYPNFVDQFSVKHTKKYLLTR